MALRKRYLMRAAAKQSLFRAFLVAACVFLSTLLAALKDSGQITVIVVASAVLAALIQFIQTWLTLSGRTAWLKKMLSRFRL